MRLTVGRHDGRDVDPVGIRIEQENADRTVFLRRGDQDRVGDLRCGYELLGSVEAPSIAVAAGGGRGSGRV